MLGAAMQVVDQNGGLQIIVRTRGGWRGAADSRREGTVQGD
jgi:gamma-glutamyltranspeptidase